VAAPAPANRLLEIATLDAHLSGIFGLVFSHDSKLLISAGGDGKARLWDVANRKTIYTLMHSHPRLVKNVQKGVFSPDGKIMATCGDDKTVKLWDTASGNHITTFEGGDEIVAVVFGPDGKTVSGAERKKLHVWSVENKKELRCVNFPSGIRPVTAYNSVKQPVLANAGTPSGRIRTQTFSLIDSVTGELILACAGHQGRLNCIALDRDETMIASTGHDLTVRLWDRANGKMTNSFAHPIALIHCLAFSPDGKILGAGYSGNVMRGGDPFISGFWLFEVPSGKILASERIAGIQTLAFSPDGRLLATDCGRLIKLWSIPEAWRKKK
jgi:WD40 repeat protein